MEANQEVLAALYNLILAEGTRQWERSQLIIAKNALENNQSQGLAQLEAVLRPLALRDNLSPDVMDFYQALTETTSIATPSFTKTPQRSMQAADTETAIFAGGCFWCMVEPFENHPGILSVLSGYTGGQLAHPTYDQVLTGHTGHVEAVEIIFDPAIITYQELLTIYWGVTDPTDAFGQFQDRGAHYRPIIFTTTKKQVQVAQASKNQLQETMKYLQPIVTEILPAKPFWPAENRHQQFYLKQPKRYRRIKRARKQLQQFKALSAWTKGVFGAKKS
ncbi:peptide-methionine (S)-S-oxide reductase [Enterococcus sp. 8G7_MSG3316]|uniref:Peptide methionine sulfoxide reductase MsrA n=1 Tax=Candidatus Enterococcus testudinis TaxID=1834191 RepID=A0A242A3V3_9ENTE|nr:peptide-methionine (S)-S-oxide reductase MsrA [Enterococcus sp. 8G7_MSG3316]OTN75715.1 peptide-methionine (S)-S-oxide reductase [Enterococcus sp. 8G7_MSG3316]